MHLESLQTKTTVRKLRNALGALPQGLLGLEKLYLDVWTRVTEKQNSDFSDEARLALCWLSCSFRQLTVRELREALVIKVGDAALDKGNFVPFGHLIRSCRGLVTEDRESKIVRLVHYTAQDFFDRNRSTFFLDAHIRMAESCLTSLSFRTFASGPTPYVSLGKLTMSVTKGPIAKRKFLVTRLRRDPFVRYATHYWGDHVRGEAEEVLQDRILTFLESPQLLKSAVQARYETEKATYARSLDCSKYLPLHSAVSFALERTIKQLLSLVRPFLTSMPETPKI